ncbi:hypothetical protein [Bartonella sp. AC134YNZD]|uniref:hypothetical protein n=1 Tax=Bartonella sp. AC134YNZD TaxID=3243446 RepID=UPI0035D07FEB
MRAFLKSIDERVWNSVIFGYTAPTILKDNVVVPKEPQTWTQAEINSEGYNSKALNAIFNAVSESEFRRIGTCELAKQAWDILEVQFEGTSTIKFSKLQRLASAFEELKMDTDETFDAFYIRLVDIINASYALGAPIEQIKIVSKILRSLPIRFQPKVVAIEELQRIEEIKVDELVSKLQQFESNFPNDSKVNSLAFKASSNCPSSSSSFSLHESLNNEELAFFVKKFKKFYKNKFENKKKTFENKKGIGSKNDDKEPNFDNSIQCYDCKGFGHYAKECANRNKNRLSLKATLDEDSENESNSDNDLDNFLAFPAFFTKNSCDLSSKDNLDITESEKSDESDRDFDDSELLELYNEFKKHRVVEKDVEDFCLYKTLEKENDELKSQLEKSQQNLINLERENARLIEKVKGSEIDLGILNKERDALVLKVEKLENDLKVSKASIEKMNSGSKKLNEILGSQKCHNDKQGIGYSEKGNKGSIPVVGKVTFVKALNEPIGTLKNLSESTSSTRVEKPKLVPQVKAKVEKVSKPNLEKKKEFVSSRRRTSKQPRNNHVQGNRKPSHVFHEKQTHVHSFVNHSRFVPTCHFCGVRGHIRPNCFKLLNGHPIPFVHAHSSHVPRHREEKSLILA